MTNAAVLLSTIHFLPSVNKSSIGNAVSQRGMSNVTRGRHFLSDVHMRITTTFKTPSKCTDYRQLNSSCLKTQFLARIVVDLIKLSTENRHRKQLASSVEALIVCKKPFLFSVLDVLADEKWVKQTHKRSLSPNNVISLKGNKCPSTLNVKVLRAKNINKVLAVKKSLIKKTTQQHWQKKMFGSRHEKDLKRKELSANSKISWMFGRRLSYSKEEFVVESIVKNILAKQIVDRIFENQRSNYSSRLNWQQKNQRHSLRSNSLRSRKLVLNVNYFAS